MATEEMRNKIIKSATALFIEHGCKRITMDGIANELHISKRTLYEYFNCKEDLLVACLTNLKESFNRAKQIFQEKNDSPIVMLLYLFKNSADYNRRMYHLFSDIQSYYPDIHSTITAHTTTEYADYIRQTLTDAEKRGDLRQNVDIELSTMLLVHLVSKLGSVVPSNDTANQKAIEMVSEGGFTYIRGLLSASTIQRYDKQEDVIRNMTNAYYEKI